eukprot:TRINITY_DN6826_c0_g1_i26.p3 TRINITY_DN6826_c0_g1~~TRINITY_DN6826_c0_g1_i26.p3  ORF type:complete len:173 (+),score=10.32 TRINITY_DN6826_c0_g1_i26:73-591(+)
MCIRDRSYHRLVNVPVLVCRLPSLMFLYELPHAHETVRIGLGGFGGPGEVVLQRGVVEFGGAFGGTVRGWGRVSGHRTESSAVSCCLQEPIYSLYLKRIPEVEEGEKGLKILGMDIFSSARVLRTFGLTGVALAQPWGDSPDISRTGEDVYELVKRDSPGIGNGTYASSELR